jgi:hypothetical protein
MRKTWTPITLVASLLVGLSAVAQSSRTPGVDLVPLDAAMVDDVLESSNGATPASIMFINKSSSAVDIYWIDYNGHRVLYRSNLAVGESWKVGTALTHPWLVVASGTGGTTTADTGVRFAGFVALTSHGDAAIIADPPNYHQTSK